MGHHCKDMASLVYRVLPQMCEGVREGQLDKSMLQGAAFQVVFMVKNPSANAGDIRDVGSIPESGRSPGGGHGNPFQYSCLENPKDRGACWVSIHRVAKSRTQLKLLSCTHTHGQIFILKRSLGSSLVA